VTAKDPNRHAVVMIAAPAAGRLERPPAGDDRASRHKLFDDLAVDTARPANGQDAAARVGLPVRLPLKRAPRASAPGLPPLVQPPPTTQLTRRPTADQPRLTALWGSAGARHAPPGRPCPLRSASRPVRAACRGGASRSRRRRSARDTEPGPVRPSPLTVSCAMLPFSASLTADGVSAFVIRTRGTITRFPRV
jgi:hypothetical protein